MQLFKLKSKIVGIVFSVKFSRNKKIFKKVKKPQSK